MGNGACKVVHLLLGTKVLHGLGNFLINLLYTLGNIFLKAVGQPYLKALVN